MSGETITVEHNHSSMPVHYRFRGVSSDFLPLLYIFGFHLSGIERLNKTIRRTARSQKSISTAKAMPSKRGSVRPA